MKIIARIPDGVMSHEYYFSTYKDHSQKRNVKKSGIKPLADCYLNSNRKEKDNKRTPDERIRTEFHRSSEKVPRMTLTTPVTNKTRPNSAMRTPIARFIADIIIRNIKREYDP